MALLAPQQVQLAGVEAAYAAAAGGGDEFKPASDVVLHVKNGGVGAINVTVVTPGSVVGQAIGDLVVAVPAAEERFIGPFPPEHFQAADGNADVTYSDVTDVTVAVLKV